MMNFSKKPQKRNTDNRIGGKIAVKALSILLVFAMILPMLFSCHGTREIEAFSIPDEFDYSKNYSITFWAKNDTNNTQINIYNQAVEEFEELYPNIRVNIKFYTNYNDIYNDVTTNIQTGTTPNICITYPDHIATYITGQNAVVPLDELLYDDKFGLGGSEVRFDAPTADEIVDKFLNECNVAGRCYALPFMRSTEACYVNKTYVEKLGYELPEVLTWDFVWEVSEAAMKKGDDGKYLVNGQSVMIPFIYKSTDNMMIQMLRQLGADYSTNNGDVLIFNEDTKEILYTVSEHAATKAFSTFKVSSYPGNALNAGQCIFAIDSTAGATWMGSNAPLLDIHESQVVEFETEVMAIPQFNTSDPKMISQGPSVCIFNKDDPGEVIASWLFTQYLLTDGVQIGYSQTEGYVPVTEKAQSNPEYLDYLSRSGEDNKLHYDVKIKAAKLLLDNLDNSFVTPVFNGSASLRNAAGQMIEETLRHSIREGELERGAKSDRFMEELFDDMVARYKLDLISVEGRINLDGIPAVSVWLLGGIGVCWVGIIAYGTVSAVKKKRAEASKNK